MAKLSIITINYNDAAGLEKTMASVNEQIVCDFEHLIIDGGSTDESLEVIRKFSKAHTRHISEKDAGIYDAQNKGIALAKGDYLIFLNAGDRFVDPYVLENVYPALAGEALIYGDMQTCDADGQIKHLKMHSKINVKVLFADTIWHPVSFFKRSVFERLGKYDLSYKIAADYEFYCRIILKYKVTKKYIPLEISIFDTTGISSDPAKKTALLAERRRVQDSYMNPILLFFFRIYSKLRN